MHRAANIPTTQPDEKDQLVAMLQEQLLLMQQDREAVEMLLREQDRIIIRQHQYLCEKDQQLSRQQQTILQQA